jgi:DHA2 family multidrug resistance protein
MTGQPLAQALQTATGKLYTTFISQSTILAYVDVFAYLGVFCFLFIPVTFFFSPTKAAGGAGGH